MSTTGILFGASKILQRYFDYAAFGRDLFLESYTEINGFVFIDR
jgi:antirestriction protein